MYAKTAVDYMQTRQKHTISTTYYLYPYSGPKTF